VNLNSRSHPISLNNPLVTIHRPQTAINEDLNIDNQPFETPVLSKTQP
jgi:hypothetical protein